MNRKSTSKGIKIQQSSWFKLVSQVQRILVGVCALEAIDVFASAN